MVEFRHTRWLNDDTYRLLQDFGTRYCNPDSPDLLLGERLTGKYGYLRLHGRRNWYADNYRDYELWEIAEKARSMVAAGAEGVYIFFNNDFEGYAPANAAGL